MEAPDWLEAEGEAEVEEEEEEDSAEAVTEEEAAEAAAPLVAALAGLLAGDEAAAAEEDAEEEEEAGAAALEAEPPTSWPLPHGIASPVKEGYVLFFRNIGIMFFAYQRVAFAQAPGQACHRPWPQSQTESSKQRRQPLR